MLSLRSRRRLLLILAGALAAGCGGARRPPVLSAPPGPATSIEDKAVPSRTLEESPDLRAVEGEGAAGLDLPTGDLEGGPLANIHFDYDSAALTDEARSTLEKHALWLQSHREATVTVEGHCDERGTVEYNLALGEQRSRAARDYLVTLGVAASRLRTVSYGKERPLDPASTEEAWARNRRAHFAVSR